MADAPRPIRSPLLAGVPHGFLTRAGGVSTDPVAGLQCGFGADDDAAAVAENRARAVAAVAPGAVLVSPYQVHSTDVVTVTQPLSGERPRADALVTDRPGLALGIVTADCAPVLFADVESRVAGAAHAGWRGAADGVLDNTVAAMVALGARREAIVAAIGPCIAPVSYEVGDDMRARFEGEDRRFFQPGRPGHWQFDLPGYVTARLARLGVRAGWTGDDTYADGARFFSYRRATHEGAASYGRQLSLIAVA